MRYLASGDETGNVKEIVCTAGTDTSLKDGKKPLLMQQVLPESKWNSVKTRIIHMKVAAGRLVALRLGGTVCIYDIEDEFALLHTYELEETTPVALHIWGETGLAVFESGKAFLFGIEEVAEPTMVDIPAHTAESHLGAFAMSPHHEGVFACGGKDNNLQILRMDKAGKVEVLFKAKNVPKDHIGLPVPIWIRNIVFFKNAEYKLVVGTHYGQVRVHDTSKARPIGSYQVCEKPITTLHFAPGTEDEIIVTDTHTFVARLLLTQVDARGHKIVSASAGTIYRPNLKIVGKYSQGGNTGATHGVDINGQLVAFGGLDRYLRVFDAASRSMAAKVYLGTQIGSIVSLPETEQKEDEERDDVWDSLESTIKKKRRVI